MSELTLAERVSANFPASESSLEASEDNAVTISRQMLANMASEAKALREKVEEVSK